MPFRKTCTTLGLLAMAGALVLSACGAPKPESVGVSHKRPTSPSGERMPEGDVDGWRQTFAEDFTSGDVARGSWPGAYGRTWSAYPEPWRDTSGNGVYSPARVLSVTGGVLDLYLHSENGQPYVAAPEPNLNGINARGQTYGRYSVRFRADAVPGYKTAWLLWPDSNERREGEIDFPEARLDSTINAFVHHADGDGNQEKFTTGKTFADWHTATTEWSPGRVRFFFDGKLIGTSTTKVPSTPMHWVLQTETALEGPPPSSSDEGHVQIDWVAAYQRAEGHQGVER